MLKKAYEEDTGEDSVIQVKVIFKGLYQGNWTSAKGSSLALIQAFEAYEEERGDAQWIKAEFMVTPGVTSQHRVHRVLWCHFSHVCLQLQMQTSASTVKHHVFSFLTMHTLNEMVI